MAGAVLGRRALLVRVRVSRHRRPIAAVLAGLAVAVGVHAARPSGAPGTDGPGRAVLVAARDLPPGHRLAVADLVERRWPEGAVPAGVVARPVGRVLDGAMRRGEPVTDVRLTAQRPGRGAGPAGGGSAGGGSTGGGSAGGGSAGDSSAGGNSARGSSTGPGGGIVAVAVRLSDPASALVARVGETVDVIAGPATGPPTGAPGSGGGEGPVPAAAVLVRSARVLTVPDGGASLAAGGGHDDPAGGSGGGLIGSLTGSDRHATEGEAEETHGDWTPAGVVIVAVPPSDALRLAGAAGVHALSLAHHPSASM